MNKILTNIHNWMPLWISSVYMPLVYLVRHIADLWLYEFVITGRMQESQSEIRLGYFGNDERIMCYWLSMIYSETIKVEKLSKVAIWRIPKKLQENPHSHEIGLVQVTGISRRFNVAKKGFVLPRWVETMLKVDKSLESLSDKKYLKNIEKHGFTFRESTSMEDLQFFYERMFRPFILSRHKDASVMVEFSYFKKRMKKKDSRLFILMKENEPLVACFNERINGRIKFAGIGVIDGRKDIIQMGSIRAIYYFMLKFYHEKGEDLIDYGGTSPLLSDGLTRFKRSMQAIPADKNPYGEKSLVLIPLKISDAVGEFLESNPFLFLDRGKFYRALFPDTVASSTKENFISWLKHRQFGGVSGNRIYCRTQAEQLYRWIAEESLSGYEVALFPAD